MTAAAAQYFDQTDQEPQPRRPKVSGVEIRARIAANRAKRLAIAEAMKREAGVTKHDVHKEDFGGLAYIAEGTIWSPEGRKIVQLYTVAHECGHIFLHRAGTAGYRLASHVQEMEAESYAHQAFREHGMKLPKRLSTWGRSYVGSWIAKDRAAGIPIDPRAEAYAAGTRSPYEPLRHVPQTWKLHRAQPPEPAQVAAPVTDAAAWRAEAQRLLKFVWWSFLYGHVLSMAGLQYLVNKGLYELKYKYAFVGRDLLLVVTGGILFAGAAVTLRSIWRRYPRP